MSKVETVYYHPYYVNTDTDFSYFLELMEMNYDLELVQPPHKKYYKSRLDLCPAINVYDNHTYILRSPVSIDLHYNYETGIWNELTPSGCTDYLIERPNDNKPYVQLAIYFIFWTEEKTNIKLWQHDPPLYTLNSLPTWYTVAGMIPISEYTRNTSVGFALRPGEDFIRINRGDAISAFTFTGESKVQLIKKEPPLSILQQNTENSKKRKLCPYTFSRRIFSKWLGKE